MTELNQLKQDVMEIGRWVESHNWCPATSGNLSARIDDQRILITVSGNAKGALTEDDLMEVNSQGDPYNSDKRPSAETLLHALIYDDELRQRVDGTMQNVEASSASLKDSINAVKSGDGLMHELIYGEEGKRLAGDLRRVSKSMTELLTHIEEEDSMDL